jgi:integrase
MGLGIEVQNLYVKVYYTESKIRKRYSTGVKLTNRDQITEKGKLKSTVPDRQKKQDRIDLIYNKLNNIVQEYRKLNESDISVVELDRLYLGQKTIKASDALLDHYKIYFDLTEKEFKTNTKRSKDSIKEYRGLYYYLNDYETETSRKILLSDINEEWMIEFRNFNLRPRQSTVDKVFLTTGGIKGNTLKKKINLFISFMRWLDKKKIHVFPTDIQGFSKTIDEQDIVKDTLSKEEIIKLRNYTFSDKKLEFIRDVFLFTCNTGMRWSDITSLSKRDIKTNEKGELFVKKKAKKTNDEYYVFLNDFAFQIFKKYNFNFNVLTNANFNKYLKLLLKETGYFNQETDFLFVSKKTGEKRFLKKYEVISIHRGRDSFINILLDEKVPINTIMRYTGHRSLSSLMKYIDLRNSPDNYLKDII